MLLFLLLTTLLAGARSPIRKHVDLRPTHSAPEVLQMAKPKYTKKLKKEEPNLDVSIKSSIPEQIVTQQAGKIDPKPYSSDAALPSVSDALKNSTNGVDLKMRF